MKEAVPGQICFSPIEEEAVLERVVEFCERILGPDRSGQYTLEAWRQRMRDYSPLLLYAHKGERIAAAVLGRPENAESLVMGQVACAEDYRRRGLTRELVRLLERNAAAMGFSYITLGALPEAEGFYEKCGYRQIAEAGGQKIYQKMLKAEEPASE